MAKTFIAGLLVLAAAVVAIVLDSALGLGLGSVLLGVAVGGILGLSSEGTPIGRLGAFLVGFLVALIGFPVRILLLNDSVVGQVLYILIVVGLVTTVCAVTKNRLPLVAGLLGIVTLVGAYEFAFGAAPQNLQRELLEYSSRVLVPVALAFLATLFAPQSENAASGTSDNEAAQLPQTSEV